MPDSDPPLLAESNGVVKKSIATLLLLGVFAGLGVLGWFAVEEARNPKDLAEVPLIKANQAPFKVEPEEPGGLDIPFKDRKVFDTIAPAAKTTDGEPEVVSVKQIAVPQKSESVMAKVEEALKPEENSVVKSVVIADKTEEKPAVAEVVKPTLRADEMKPEVVKVAPKKPVEVASVSPKAVVKTTPTKRSAMSGRYMIQLGSYSSEKGAVKAWGSIQSKFSDQLRLLEQAVKRADLGSKGTFYRLYAGPFDSRDTASKICKNLSKRQQGCIVAQP